MLEPPIPAVQLEPSDKLETLRRLDPFRLWSSIDDQRRCLQCGKIITGREIHLVGMTDGREPLRAQCPTPDCLSIPLDWALVNPEPDFNGFAK